MLDYKRISKGFWNYALYPADIDIDKLIARHGKDKDYYQSIYIYKEEHYKNYIENLKKACEYLNIKYDENNMFNIFGKVYPTLKKLSEEQNDQIAKTLKENISISGTKNIKTNKLVFDFDSKKIELARIDTVKLCKRLIDSGIDESCLQISFSGNKGFSVEVETCQEFSRKEFETLVGHFSKGLKTFDAKVKDEQRLFRITMTIHNSSGLYKIPISLEEINRYRCEDIIKKAEPSYVNKNKSKFYDLMNTWNVVDHILDTPEPVKEEPTLDDFLEESKTEESSKFLGSLDLSKKPQWLSATKYALQEGFFGEGERNHAFMILAATYRANGFSKTIAFNMLKAVAELQHRRTGQTIFSEKELQRNVVDFVYSDNWKGGTYSEKETELLKKTAEIFGLKDDREDRAERKLYSVNESLVRFQEYAKNFSKNRIKTGLTQLDNNLVLTSGMTCGLLGSPGSGKTTFSNLFMKYTSKNGERVLFESLDMSENFIIARYIQNYVDYDFEQIMTMLEDGNISPELELAMEKIAEEYKNVSINFKTSTNIEDIEKDIIKHKEMFGEVPRLIVIDYLEKIRGPYTDSNANTAYIASRLTDLAKEYNTFILLLLQPQKQAGDPSYPLLSMRKVKGSSVIEQDCRVILSMWRPGFNPTTMEDDKFASIAVVKNNMGKLGQYDFSWNGASGELRDLTEEEQYQLEELNDRIAQQRSEEESNGW